MARPNCALVRPERESPGQKRLIERAKELAEQSGFFYRSLHAADVRVVGGSGRKMNVLGPADASQLYRSLHLAPTLVLANGSVLVSVDPSRNPPNARAACSLATFVAYKSIYALTRAPTDVDAAFEGFERWIGEVNCGGPNDPRALPFHIFDGNTTADLATEEGVQRFRQQFGAPNTRIDGSARCWERGTMHGQGSLNVAGCDLPAGMHWDVSGRRQFRLMNASEIWKVDRGGYLNVYPDEHVRGPAKASAGHARRVWVATGKKNAPR